MWKSFAIGFLTCTAFLLVVGVRASRQQNTEGRSYQAELLDATPVQRGLLTEKQRRHSKLYNFYKERNNRAKISDLVEQVNRDVVQIDFYVPLLPLLEPETPEKYFEELAQASDAVIRGIVTSKASQLTEDDTFIFTDYEVMVIEVLKKNGFTPLDAGAIITVTRPGGKVLVDGVIIKVIEHSFAPLPVNNHDVVLFLKARPETGTFESAAPTGSFELDGSVLRALTNVPFPPGVLRDGKSFLQTARAVMNK
jgi:hypothetical protein